MTQPVPRFPTSIGVSDADRITLLGQDLAADLMGRVSFGELALWLVTQQRPTAAQVRVFEAVLVALASASARNRPVSSVTPRNRDPPPSRPAASAPCTESGADR